MQDEHTQPRRERYFWNGTALNVYTVSLLLAAPFWTASMILRDNEVPIFFLWLSVVALMALATLEKPLFSYDPKTQAFESVDGQRLLLSQIDTIEMDVREIYFIPKSHLDVGMHLKQRCWVLTPRSALLAAAEQHGWPIKDISTPLTRMLYMLLP